jgi:hypothetical protein
MTVVKIDDCGRVDRVFDALSAGPRRRLVDSLLDAAPDERIELPEGASPPDCGSLDELRLDLAHRHLPMLADSGFVKWEREPLSARRGPRFDEVAAVFETLSVNAASLPESLVAESWELD